MDISSCGEVSVLSVGEKALEKKDAVFGVENIPYLNIPPLVGGEIVKVVNENAPDAELPILKLFEKDAFCAYFNCDRAFNDGDYAYVKERRMESEFKQFAYCRNHLLSSSVKHIVRIKEEQA